MFLGILSLSVGIFFCLKITFYGISTLILCCSFIHEISFFELSKESLFQDSFSNFKLHRILFSIIVKSNFVFVHEMVIHVEPQERTQERSRKRKFILERRSHSHHMEGMLRERVQPSRWGGDREKQMNQGKRL